MDDRDTPIAGRVVRPRIRLQPLVKDLYRELDLRRRRAQIAARKQLEEEQA